MNKNMFIKRKVVAGSIQEVGDLEIKLKQNEKAHVINNIHMDVINKLTCDYEILKKQLDDVYVQLKVIDEKINEKKQKTIKKNNNI